ncbi:MAG: alpha/beta hydrolase [Clostridiales bacterium]|nr:alpha/beta hydrolase [Clostridiales bacterium]
MIIPVLGIPSHVEQWGSGEEEILLLHGWGRAVTLERHLAPLARLLADDGCRVTALEFPAHGQSGKPQDTWGVPEYAQWTQAAMDALDIKQATIVAHSFGGRVALWLAANQAQRVRRLVLTGAAGLRREQTAEEQAAAERYQRQKKALDGIKAVPLLGRGAALLQKTLRDRRSSPDYLEADEDMKATFVRIVSQDLRPLLAHITQPTLLVWGEQDDATPLWMGQEMERAIKDAALIVFEGRGHFAYLEEAGRFAAIVKALIREDAKQSV